MLEIYLTENYLLQYLLISIAVIQKYNWNDHITVYIDSHLYLSLCQELSEFVSSGAEEPGTLPINVIVKPSENIFTHCHMVVALCTKQR
jgi:hypothetical protein